MDPICPVLVAILRYRTVAVAHVLPCCQGMDARSRQRRVMRPAATWVSAESRTPQPSSACHSRTIRLATDRSCTAASPRGTTHRNMTRANVISAGHQRPHMPPSARAGRWRARRAGPARARWSVLARLVVDLCAGSGSLDGVDAVQHARLARVRCHCLALLRTVHHPALPYGTGLLSAAAASESAGEVRSSGYLDRHTKSGSSFTCIPALRRYATGPCSCLGHVNPPPAGYVRLARGSS